MARERGRSLVAFVAIEVEAHECAVPGPVGFPQVSILVRPVSQFTMIFAPRSCENMCGNNQPNAHVAKRCRRFPNAIMIANLAGVFARGNPSERALSSLSYYSVRHPKAAPLYRSQFTVFGHNTNRSNMKPRKIRRFLQ